MRFLSWFSWEEGREGRREGGREGGREGEIKNEELKSLFLSCGLMYLHTYLFNSCSQLFYFTLKEKREGCGGRDVEGKGMKEGGRG